ncbi:DUF4190 domain-containing protein [Streptomyces sp. NPDC051567]|uniref:DUF4190 domain-containing protein n=1 Tax=Streptomyces sp. NPDC051567 TaxID=3365660 RepID=UPI0037A70FC0
MSTPPNPSGTPAVPPTEPVDPSISGAAPAPEPGAARPLSLEKDPGAVAPAAGTGPEPVPAAPAAPGAPAAPEPSAFAPVATAPAPAYGGGPGGPGNPWGPPGAGHTMPYPGYPQAAPVTNGLAVATLVLGICSVLIGATPFFFWLGAVLALTAVGIGIGAVVRASKGAPRKAMSIAGTVLGVLGLGASVGGFFLTTVVVDEAVTITERQLEEAAGSSASPTPSPSQVPGLTSALPFGETFAYDGGIKVSLSAPKKYQPKDAYARTKVKNAVQLTVTITNNSTAPHEMIYVVPHVRDAQGMTAELVYDGTLPNTVKGSILPGESASGILAYEVPEGTTSISADVSAGTMLNDVKFSGPIG